MAPFVSADPPQVLQTGKEGTIEWIPEHVEGSNNIGYSNPSDEFSLVKGLGQGSMGTVFLAVHRSTKKPYAMKVMSKDVLRRRDAFKMASMERDILSTLDHPFLPSLLTHFESEKHTFLAMKYCSGGDINVLRHRQPNKTFSESATRFYAAEVVLALEYLHEQGIVYRDLKPENILVQDNGHIMLTDFDLSVRLSSKGQSGRTSPENHSRPHKVSRSTFGFIRRERKFQNTVGNEPSKRSNYGHEKVGVPCAQSHSFVGTKEYIAPEIIWCTGHGFPVDWWSLGIFLYEMVHGSTPFSGATRKETFFNILCRDPPFPGPWSSLQDLIQKLLVKEPSKRLGSLGGADEVKRHEFFRGLRWDALEFVSRPPFVPPLMSPDEIISNRQPLYETMLVGSDRSDESTHTITSAECLAIEDYPNDLFGSGSAFNHF